MRRKTLLLMLLMALGATGAMYAQTSLPWSENFENYTSTTLGSEWATPATYGGKPCVLRGNSWASPAGSNSLECRTNSSNSNVFVFPQFNKPLNTLTVQFKIGGHTSGRGQFGYVTNASSASSFVSLTDIAQPSTVGSGSNGYTQYNYDLSTMSAPTNSTYRLAVKYTFVGSDEDSWYFDDFSVTYTEPSGGGVTPTCTPSFSSSTDFIASFSLGDINNSSSGFSSGGYGNFTSMSTNLQPGTSISASLTSSSGSGTHAAAVWIDFNDDGTFDSSTERVGTQGSIGASATVNISLSIPSNAAPGRHLMRVVYQYNVGATSINPCASASYGEGEDYMVNIIAGPASLPYTENFENGQNGWEFGNGTQTNYWMVGSNTTYSSSNSLYITNNGSTNAYSHTTSYVYAYRKLNIPSAGDYVVSFKWKANGESSYDLLRAFMIPTSVNPTLTGGTNNGQSSSTNTTPTGWIDVANPSGKLNLQSSWQSSEKNVNLSTAGVYYLVFFWKNDGGSGSTPPAAVDDIDIHEAATYNVTVSANGSGTVSGGGNNIAEGASVTVTATPNVGYNFVNWTENGTEVSTNPSYTFTLEGDRNLVANFEAWTLNVASEPASTECLTPGTEVVLTTSSNIPTYNNYTFTQTTETFSSISGSPDGTSTSTGDGVTFAFQLPFAFNLAGKDFAQGTTLTMRCDGYVSLGSSAYSSHTPSSPGSTYTMIAPFGYDQYLDNYSKMYYKTTTENGAQVLIMEWNNMRSYSNSNRANYQVKLYEGSNIVKFCYGSFTYDYSTSIYTYLTADGKMTQLTSSYASPVVVTNTTGSTPSGISVNSASTAPANGTVYTFAPLTYTWTANGTQGTANDNVYTVTPTENSSYTVSTTINGQTYTETVEVTMQALTKTIEAYGNSERGGYYLIASPIEGSIAATSVTNLTSNTFNFYMFDQTGNNGPTGNDTREWINYAPGASSHPFNEMVNGKGYLYANINDVTLTFAGKYYDGDGKVTLTRDDRYRFAGWNLVGNPFAQTAYFTNDFYTLNEDRDEVVAGTTKSVEAMEGIFVVATSDGETMTFSTTPLGKSNSQMSINVVRNRGNVIDRAIVRFDEESLLPKFQLNPNHTKVYIPQNGSDYAVVYADGAGTMPVNFKAEDNGRYTLNFTTENVNFNYLHLIDNMTGTNVDLLATPTYTFDTKSTDYASRFTLVFATGNNDGESTFAFFNNGNWIINNDGEATLQVVDVMGRVLSSETISGSCSKTLNVAPGVYMLRLINGDKVKVQKIVVKR